RVPEGGGLGVAVQKAPRRAVAAPTSVNGRARGGDVERFEAVEHEPGLRRRFFVARLLVGVELGFERGGFQLGDGRSPLLAVPEPPHAVPEYTRQNTQPR